MKLHLPKQLFTALLAVITLAAPAALTLSSTAWGAAAFTTSSDGTTATYSGTANDMQFSGIGNDVDKVILNTSGGWLNNTTLNADVLVQIGADDNDGTTGLVLTDGGGSTYTIANKVIGSGLIKKTGNGKNMVLQFTGDVSEYTGNINLNSKYTFTLWFGGQGISAVSTATNGASGTGTITFAQGSGLEHILKYSYAPSETPIYITNEIVTTGAGTSKIEISNGADYIFTKDVTVNALTAGADSTLTFNGALTLNGTVSVHDAITANGAVTLGSGVVFDLAHLTAGEDNCYTLFTGAESISFSDVSFTNGRGGWSYTMQSNGTALGTFDGKTVTWHGDNDSATTFEWGEGTTFAEGGAFATYDNVNITGFEDIKLTSEITANQVTIGAAEGADIIVKFTSDSNVLKVQDGFVIRDGATVEVDKSTGGTGFIQGEVTIENGGVLKFNKKDVTGYNGGATSMHTINVQAGGELQLNITGNETFAGTLNLDGTVKGVHTGGSARFDMFGGKATINVGANTAASMENINLQLRQNDSVITVGDNATLSLSGTITKAEGEGNGVLYKNGAGSMVVGGNVGITTLNLGAGTMDLQGGASITNVNIANGTTLTLGKEGAENDTTYTITNLTGAATGSVLKLESNATLDKLTSVTNSVTLTGSGTYNYGTWDNASKFTPEFTLDLINWTGTVALTGGDRGKPLDNLAAASTVKSKLKLTGFKGYLDGTRKMSNNLILDNGDVGYGLLLDNGGTYDNANVTFSGSIEGDGHIIYGWKNTNNESDKSYTATHIFSGDTSEWNGMFIRDLTYGHATGNNYGKTVMVKFTAGGDVFKENGNGGVMDGEKSGQLDVVIDAAASDGVKPDTNFHGAITDVNSVTVSSNTDFKKAVTTASLTVDASTNASFDSTLDADTVTLNASSTLALGGGTAEAQKQHSIGTLSAAAAGVTLGDYATLALGDGTTESTHSVDTLTGGAGSKLELAANSVLDKVDTINGTVTLTGSGTYNLGSQAITNDKDTLGSISQGLSLGADWNGTVKLDSGTTLQDKGHNFNFDDFVNIQSGVSVSTVELEGVSGHLGKDMTTCASIRLTGEGLEITDTYSSTTYTFNGSISGLGKLEITKDLSSTFTFNGDTSQWSGDLIQTAGAYTYNFNGGSTIANNFESSVASEDFKVNVSNAQDVSLTGTLKAKNAAGIQVERTDSNGNLSVKSVELEGTGSVKIQGLKLSATDTTEATAQNPASIAAKDDTDGALTYLAQEASFTIADMTLTNTSITAATVDTRVELKNVSGDVALKTGIFGVEMTTVGMGGSALSYAEGAPSITLSSTDAGAAKLMISANPTLDVQGTYGTYSLTFNLNLQLDTSIDEPASNEAWGELVGFEGWLGTMLEEQNATFAGAAGEPVAQSSAPSVSYGYTAGSDGNVGTLVITINGLNVPEPTTSTLSLLALAGLCARRRRKM